LQVGRYNAVLHKLFSMKEGAPAPQLEGSLQAAIILENDRPEYKFLGNEFLMAGSRQQGNVAAQVSVGQLFNPAGSGVLCVLEEFSWDFSGTTTLLAGIVTTALVTVGTKAFRDSRQAIIAGQGACQVFGSNSVATGLITPQLRIRGVADVAQTVRIPFVLSPGNGFQIESTGSNVIMRYYFAWRERHLEPSETR